MIVLYTLNKKFILLPEANTYFGSGRNLGLQNTSLAADLLLTDNHSFTDIFKPDNKNLFLSPQSNINIINHPDIYLTNGQGVDYNSELKHFTGKQESCITLYSNMSRKIVIQMKVPVLKKILKREIFLNSEKISISENVNRLSFNLQLKQGLNYLKIRINPDLNDSVSDYYKLLEINLSEENF